MKPARFGYAAPRSLDEALGLLGEDAAVLAGGQSLVPELNFRDQTPATLVDINRVPGIDRVEEVDGGLRIGALVRHSRLEREGLIRTHCPLLPAAARFVAHPPVRNRGTFGGSVSNAHPAAELTAVVALADGSVELASLEGTRTLEHAEFARGAFETARRPDELVTGVRLMSLGDRAWGFHEITRREREYALAGAVAALKLQCGAIVDARVALFGVEAAPRRLRPVERALAGAIPAHGYDADLGGLVRDVVRPASEEASVAAYRRALADVAVQRAVRDALQRGKAAA